MFVSDHKCPVKTHLMNSEIASSTQNIFFEADESRYDVRPVIALLQSYGFGQTFKNGGESHYDLMFERRKS
jgi:hypothetical protein